MSKLNKKAVAPKKALPPVAISYNGNPQYAKSAKQDLFELAVGFLFGKDSYYESSDAKAERMHKNIATLVAMNEFDFIANTIKYARSNMHIRTAPVMMAVMFAYELRRQNKSYEHLRAVVRDVIQRADQLKDTFAYALDVFGATLPVNKRKNAVPLAIKRGVADAFSKFNEYQFAKWKGSGEGLKLRDVLWITHPTPVSAYHGVVFDKIMKDNLTVPFTWEVELSRNGQLPIGERLSEKDIWTKMVSAKDEKDRYVVGYMALLRNLRNIQNANLDDKVLKTHVLTRISNKDEVLNSKQLPFDFVEAYEAINDDNRIKAAVSMAIDISVANMPVLGNNVWVLVDNSSSMNNTYEQMNSYYRRGKGEEVKGVGKAPSVTAALFAAALFKVSAMESKNFAITLFSSHATIVKNLNPTDSVITIAEKILAGIAVPAATNLSAALETKRQLGFEPDAVIMFSDGQVDVMPRGTRIETNIFTKNCVKVSFNLGAYSSTPLSEAHGWYQLSGWSQSIFDFVPLMREKVSIADVMSGPYVPNPKPVAKYEPKVEAYSVKKKPVTKKKVTKKPTVTKTKVIKVATPRKTLITETRVAKKKKTSKAK